MDSSYFSGAYEVKLKCPRRLWTERFRLWPEYSVHSWSLFLLVWCCFVM